MGADVDGEGISFGGHVLAAGWLRGLVRFFSFLLGNSGSREEVILWATKFSNFGSALYGGGCGRTGSFLPSEVEQCQ